eukprot:13770777-Alexandrium_andersonii.AAC.1
MALGKMPPNVRPQPWERRAKSGSFRTLGHPGQTESQAFADCRPWKRPLALLEDRQTQSSCAPQLGQL